MLNCGPLGLHLVDDWLERCIIEQDPVLSVIDDILKLILEQPGIYCVQHPASTGHAIPADQVPRVVHRQAGDTLSRLDPQSLQRLRHFKRIGSDTRPIGSGFSSIRPAGDNFTLTGFTGGVVDYGGYPHGPILHGSKHGHLSPE